MIDPTDLSGLLRSYADGDVLARKVLVDFLSEEGDDRAEKVRDEGIDWDEVARQLAGNPPQADSHWWARQRGEQPRIRWWIDCVRFGNSAPEFVTSRVRQERLSWLAGLFPECGLLEK